MAWARLLSPVKHPLPGELTPAWEVLVPAKLTKASVGIELTAGAVVFTNEGVETNVGVETNEGVETNVGVETNEGIETNEGVDTNDELTKDGAEMKLDAVVKLVALTEAGATNDAPPKPCPQLRFLPNAEAGPVQHTATAKVAARVQTRRMGIPPLDQGCIPFPVRQPIEID